MRAAEGDGHSIRFICHTRGDGRAQQQHNAPSPSSRTLNERVHGSDSEEADAIEIRFFFPQA